MKANQAVNEKEKRASWYSVALDGNPARKQENKRKDRQSVALNGNPASKHISEPDFHLVNRVTIEGEN